MLAIYDDSTGEVTRMMDPGLRAFEDVMVVASGEDTTHYVDLTGTDPVWTERPEMTASYADDTLTAPEDTAWAVLDPTTLVVLATGVVGETGESEIIFEDAGTYRIDLYLFPYLPKSLTVEI